MAKINKAALKAYFQTGKIPTQSNFADLIDSVINIPDGGGDSTLVLGNGDKNGAPYVRGYRFVTIGNESSYIFIGLYDAAKAAYIPYIIMKCSTGSPSEYGNTPPVNYTILTSELMTEMYNVLGGDMHSVNDNTIVSAIPSQVEWCTVGYNIVSDTHQVVKNLLSEEHFFNVIEGVDKIYFRVVYSNKFPIITNAIRINHSKGPCTVYHYILRTFNNLVDFDTYKRKFYYIMSNNDIQITEVLDFINTYMKDINLTN